MGDCPRLAILIGYLAGGGARSVLKILDEFVGDFEVTICPLLKATGARNEVEDLREGFKDLGAQVASEPPQGVLNPRSWLSLHRLLREQDISIVHTQSPYSGFLGRVAGRAAGVPVVVSTQHLPTRVYSLRTRILDQLTFPLADSVVCVSEGVRDSFRLARKLVPNRLTVIHNGVELSKIDRAIDDGKRARIAHRFGFNYDDPLVGNVARLAPQKDQSCLIEAMREVVDQKENARLLIVGWGALEEELRSHVDRLGLHSNVFLLGRKPAAQVFSIMRSIDVFALSSIYEGFSLTILEAMACSRPVVSTNVTGVQEAVVDGQTGTLVPARNPEALAGAILELLNNPDRARDMGISGRARVERHFSSSVMAKQYKQLYHELMQQKGLSVAST